MFSSKIKLKSEKDVYRFQPKKDLIGSGASGMIFKAKTSKDKRVVLKIVFGSFDFEQEVKCNKEILKFSSCTKYFVCMIDSFETYKDKYPYAIVFPYLENYLTLDKVLNSQITLNQYNEIKNQLTEAITYMNNKGIFHNDIHTENIMVNLSHSTSSGSTDVRLIDLGNCNIQEEIIKSLVIFTRNDITSLSMILPEVNKQITFRS